MKTSFIHFVFMCVWYMHGCMYVCRQDVCVLMCTCVWVYMRRTRVDGGTHSQSSRSLSHWGSVCQSNVSSLTRQLTLEISCLNLLSYNDSLTATPTNIYVGSGDLFSDPYTCQQALQPLSHLPSPKRQALSSHGGFQLIIFKYNFE